MADVIIDRTAGLGPALVGSHFAGVSRAPAPPRLRRAIVIEDDGQADAARFYAQLPRVLEAADAMLPADVWPAYLVLTTFVDLATTTAFDQRRASRWLRPPLMCRRGTFLGVLAVDGQGMAFFDPEGRACDAMAPAAWALSVLDAARLSSRPATLSTRLHL